MIAGVSLIQRVYERAVRAQRTDAVYVATDDARIAGHVESFGGRVLQPEGDFQSGTDRIAAALRLLDDSYDAAINVQGDEPLIDPEVVDRLISALAESEMTTLACPLLTDDEFQAREEATLNLASAWRVCVREVQVAPAWRRYLVPYGKDPL